MLRVYVVCFSLENPFQCRFKCIGQYVATLQHRNSLIHRLSFKHKTVFSMPVSHCFFPITQNQLVESHTLKACKTGRTRDIASLIVDATAWITMSSFLFVTPVLKNSLMPRTFAAF